MTDRKTLWNEAGKAGLLLGGVSVAYLLVTALLGKVNLGLLGGVLNFLLWAAKLTGCILLMRFLMRRFAANGAGTDNADTFRFGVVAALCSALLYSACYLAYVTFLAPDLFNQVFETLAQNPMLDAASRNSIAAMAPSMPKIAFFVNLVYCFLFGTILSAILSRNIPDRNPFAQS